MLEYEFHCKVLASDTCFESICLDNTFVGNDNTMSVFIRRNVEIIGTNIKIFTISFANSAFECYRF